MSDELTHQSYLVSASVTPGTLVENERMPVAVFIGFLRGLADGLEARRVDPPQIALVVSTLDRHE